MTSENELLNALVKTLPFVKDLEEELAFYKKELKHEKKSAKKWKKKHDALMQILYDYPCLMRGSDSESIPVRVPMNKCTIDLTQDDEPEESNNTPILFSSDISAIKKEKIIKIEVDETLKNEIAMIEEVESDNSDNSSDNNSDLEEGEILEVEINGEVVDCSKKVQPTTDNANEEIEVEVEEEQEEEEEEEMEVEVAEEEEEEEIEVEVEEEEEEEQEEEEEEEQEEEEEEQEEEEEDEEELMEFDIGDKTYLVTDEKNGIIYDYINEEDVGDELGVLKNGIPKWHKK